MKHRWKLVSAVAAMALATTGMIAPVYAANGSSSRVADDQLIAAYDFSETAGQLLHDRSGNGNDGTVVGATAWEKGTMSFSGDNYVQLPDDLVKGRAAATVTVEAKPDAAALSHNNFLFNIGGTGTSQNGGTGQWFVSMNNHEASITATNWQGENKAHADKAFTADRWQSIAVSIAPNDADDTSTLVLYVDGQEVARNAQSTANLSDLLDQTHNVIGASAYAEDAKFTGSISNFRVYGTALDESAIAGIAKADSQEVSDEAAGRPYLEEAGGVAGADEHSTIVHDANYGNVLTIDGGWIANSSTSGPVTSAVGTFVDTSVFQSKEWTLSADVKVTDPDTVVDNWNKKAAFTIGNAQHAVNVLLGAGKLGWGNTDGGYSEHTVDFDEVPERGQWVALSLVYRESADSATVSLFVNGKQVVSSVNLGFTFGALDNVSAYIGHGYNTSFVLNGLYDAIVLDDKALDDEAAAAYTLARLQDKQSVEQSQGPGYLWLYFQASDYEKVNYGYSKDGRSWSALNNGESIMSSPSGTKGIRDPHILRLQQADASGYRYVMLGTDLHAEGTASGGSWDQISASTALVVSKSKDLVNWTTPQLVQTGLAGKVGNAWAPEAIWDEQTNDYLVYWSSRDLSTGGTNPTTSNTALKVYKAHTTDFTSFTEPTVWIDQSSASMHNIIDTTIVQGEDGRYYRFSTSDWWTVVDVADSLEGQWHRLIERDSDVTDGKSIVTGDTVRTTTQSGLSTHIEGLTVYQMPDGSWMVMGDNGGYAGWSIGALADIANDGAFHSAGATFSSRFRHGTVMRLSDDEQTAVLAAYGDADGDAVEVPADEDGSGPIAQYTFDDGSASDVTGNGRDLTLYGSASIERDDDSGSSALVLDGSSGSYAQFPQGMFDGRNSLTVSMDVRTDLSGNMFTFTFGKDTQKYYFMRYRNTGELGNHITVGSYQQEAVADASVDAQGWHNITVTFDGVVMTSYFDGVQVAQNANTGLPVTSLGKRLMAYLGKSFYDDPYFRGAFDNVTVWNRTLNAMEIARMNDAPALAGATVGSVPTAEEAADLRGTDTHTSVRTNIDADKHVVTSVVNRRADVHALAVTLSLTYADTEVLLDGKAFHNGDIVDMSKDHTLTVSYPDQLHRASEEWTLKASTVSNNPVLPGQYADPDIDYFDGKFWIYPTTDGFSGWSGNYFHAFSSTDLQNWTDEGVILDVNRDHQPTTDGDEDTAISPWSVGSAWAPTIEKKNGKYYFYYCAKLPNGTSAIGVAVADSPAGPFRVADQPLVTNNMEGVTVGQAIDPSVFTDDDGTSYLLYGNGSAAMVQLGDDMMSVVPGSARRISGLNDFRESVVVAKRDGIYHWTWSCDDAGSPNYHVNYGTSTSLIADDGTVGPTEQHGTLLQKDSDKGIQGTAHQSVVSVVDANGQERWFMAYHRHYTPLGVFTDGLGYHRETAIEEITFDEQGIMRTLSPTDEGAGAVKLADVSALNAELQESQGIVRDDADGQLWKTFVQARSQADDVLQTMMSHGAAQSVVDSATQALHDARQALSAGADDGNPNPNPNPNPDGEGDDVPGDNTPGHNSPGNDDKSHETSSGHGSLEDSRTGSSVHAVVVVVIASIAAGLLCCAARKVRRG